MEEYAPMRTRWFLALALLGLAVPARAGLIPAAVNVAPDGANFRFTYTIVLPSDYKLKSGDYFTIYDFKGYVPASFLWAPGPSIDIHSSGWAQSAPMIGQTPPHVNPIDNHALPNLTFTYSGPTLIGPQNLGDFSVDSQFGGRIDGVFASRDYSQLLDHVVGTITGTHFPGNARHPPQPAALPL